VVATDWPGIIPGPGLSRWNGGRRELIVLFCTAKESLVAPEGVSRKVPPRFRSEFEEELCRGLQTGEKLYKRLLAARDRYWGDQKTQKRK